MVVSTLGLQLLFLVGGFDPHVSHIFFLSFYNYFCICYVSTKCLQTFEDFVILTNFQISFFSHVLLKGFLKMQSAK